MVFFVFSLTALAQKDEKKLDRLQKEEELDYFKKWLKEDAVYIITPEENAVLTSLTTEEEKEHFVEQFWRRRDPDPRTALNEFKEEHYRPRRKARGSKAEKDSQPPEGCWSSKAG